MKLLDQQLMKEMEINFILTSIIRVKGAGPSSKSVGLEVRANGSIVDVLVR